MHNILFKLAHNYLNIPWLWWVKDKHFGMGCEFCPPQTLCDCPPILQPFAIVFHFVVVTILSVYLLRLTIGLMHSLHSKLKS